MLMNFLYMFSLPNNGSDIKEVKEYDVQGVIYNVVVDLHSQMIYVVYHPQPNDVCLVRFDYAENNKMVLHEGDDLSNQNGMDVFNGSIVWFRENTIYICKPNPTCSGQNMYKVHTSGIRFVSIMNFQTLKHFKLSYFQSIPKDSINKNDRPSSFSCN